MTSRQKKSTWSKTRRKFPANTGRPVLSPPPRRAADAASYPGRRSVLASEGKGPVKRREARAIEHMGITLRPGLERDTLLIPWVIADSVCGEVSAFLGVEFPDRYVDWLDAKAERCYAGHRHFQKRMRGAGNAPRDWLYVFMRHWLDSMLKLERPDLHRCLPREFGNGRRLPPGTHPRENRRGFIRDLLPASRPWDASRVTRHFRWAWLPDGRGNGEVPVPKSRLRRRPANRSTRLSTLRPHAGRNRPGRRRL